MPKINRRYFVGDFETTVFQSQTRTEVWASALVELGTEDVTVLHSIDDTFNFLVNLNSHLIVYYHNLKFDGTFWLYFIMNKTNLRMAVDNTKQEFSLAEPKKMEKGTYSYVISARGQWYSIYIKTNKGYVIELRDSLKLLPFSVKRIGESFNTKHKKLDMEYEGRRYAGCEITPEEMEYIKNDVLVVKEALEIMFEKGHKKITIGACCMSEFKEGYGRDVLLEAFPQLYNDTILDGVENCPDTVGNFILKSYKGGWCYVVKGKENKVFHNGITVDANSLYPSVMHSDSGYQYPTGHGEYVKIQSTKLPLQFKMILDGASDGYFFIRLRTRFYLKKGMLPTIQIKGHNMYKGTEWLETSDIKNKITGEWCKRYVALDGTVKEAIPELTLSWTDYKLLIEHYDLKDTYLIDAIWFKYTDKGLFDKYINKYRDIKIQSKGAIREIAKLFLNNLYGKFATKTDSSFKVALIKNNALTFEEHERNDREGGYIAIGAAITSYARYTTINKAQANYYGVDKRGFIYADTDSLHCDLRAEELKDIAIDDVKFCCWKVEGQWEQALFVRQKTYIEQMKTSKGLQYQVKCAGLPDFPKKLFVESLGEQVLTKDERSKLTEREQAFIEHRNTIEDFKLGLIIPSKLMPKQIEGGTVLVSVDFSMR